MSFNFNHLLFFLIVVSYLPAFSSVEWPPTEKQLADVELTEKEDLPHQYTDLLSVNEQATVSMMDTTICFGTCLVLGSDSFCESGSYEYTTATGSTEMINLTISPANGSNQNLEVCFGEVFRIGFEEWAIEGNYEWVYEDQNQCDSTVNYYLTVLEEIIPTTIDTFLCAGECYEPPYVGSNKLCTTNFSEETYRSTDGCDSLVIINVVIERDLTNRLKRTICVGECVTIGDSTICETGQYDILLLSSTNCDSLVSMDLTVSNEIIYEVREIICEGEEFEKEDTVLTTSGQYEFYYESFFGCDSTVIVDLVVGEETFGRVSQDLCIGEQFEVMDGKGSIIRAGGDYNFVFSSMLGCDSVVTFSVTQVDTVAVNLTDTICAGDSLMLGSFAITAAGKSRTVLTSAENCDSIIYLDLTVLDCRIVAIVATDSTKCSDDLTGRFSFKFTDGTPPFNYTWHSVDSNYTGSGIIEELNEELILEGLPAGEYRALVKDSIGIQTSRLTFHIESPTYMDAEWNVSEYNGYNISCANGTDGLLEVIPSGGRGAYTYEWSNGATTAMLTELASDNYTVTIRDAFNCSYIVQYDMTEPPEVQLDITSTKPNCDSLATGSIQVVSATGGVQPYIFELTNIGQVERDLFKNLLPGFYTLVATDENGCAFEFEYDLPAPEIPDLAFEHTYLTELADPIAIQIESNVELPSIIWSEEEGLSCYTCIDPTANPLETTDYSFVATSVDGCTAEGAITVSVKKERDVFVPNIFSPNGDGLNDRLVVFGGPEVAQVGKLLIFSRWGELVYERHNFPPNDPLSGWDGTFKGKKFSAGSFVWMATVDFVDGEVLEYTGDIVIR